MEKEIGRPRKYTAEELLDKSNEYIRVALLPKSDGGLGHIMHKHVALALYLGVNTDTIYEWAKEFPSFSDILKTVKCLQENELLENGLGGTYNAMITKLVLGKHGYKEQTESTNTNIERTQIIDDIGDNEE